MSTNLLTKLMKIQTELKAPKGQYNSFGKYNYRNCEDILEALKPLLTQTKTTLIVEDDIVLVGDRYYVKAIATLYDCETESEKYSVAYAREEENKKGMDSSQLTGSTSSYARKYALNGLFAIDDTKDSDTTNKHDKEEVAAPKVETKTEIKPTAPTNNKIVASDLISESQQKRMFGIAKGDQEIVLKVLQQAKLTTTKQVKKKDYEILCNLITKFVKEKEEAPEIPKGFTATTDEYTPF